MQFLFSPMFIGVFLSTLMILEGRASQVVSKLQQVIFKAFMIWALWVFFFLLPSFSLIYIFFFCMELLFWRSGFLLFSLIGNCGYLSNLSTSGLCHSSFRFELHNAFILFLQLLLGKVYFIVGLYDFVEWEIAPCFLTSRLESETWLTDSWWEYLQLM